MHFNRYLSSMGRLYMEGALSNFHPDLLKRLGGSLALAGRDKYAIHFEEDAFLWFDIGRNPQEMWEEASRKWAVHRDAIRQLLESGRPPDRAVYEYMRRFDTYPHRPQQVQQMLQPYIDSTGTHSTWMRSTLEFRRRFRRGSRVMTDTFGAIATMVALAITAEDFHNATPAEWDRALNYGEVGVLMGQMAGAHTDARQQFQDAHRQASQRTSSPAAQHRAP